jgi:hypothetical protein
VPSKESVNHSCDIINRETYSFEASMAQELLTYLELAQRLNVSMAAAKGIVEGLQMPRYAAPDGKVVVFCDVSELRGTKTANSADVEPGRRARRTRDKGRYVHSSLPAYADPLRLRPARTDASRIAMVASLHERIDELQRRLDRVEARDADDAAEVAIPPLIGPFGIAAQAAAAKQAADKVREEIAAYRSRPWWKRLSA